MRLVIVRHAEAAAGSPDELRPLTSRGKEQAREVGRRLRDELGEPDAILSSPLLRARETAQALGLGQAEPDDRLAPGATVENVRDAIDVRGETVVVVGHQPDCGRIAAALGAEAEEFPPAGVCVVEL